LQRERTKWDAERVQWNIQRSDLEQRLAESESKLAESVQRLAQLECQLAEVGTQHESKRAMERDPTAFVGVPSGEAWLGRGEDVGQPAAPERSIGTPPEAGVSELPAPCCSDSPTPATELPPVEYEATELPPVEYDWTSAAKRQTPEWPAPDISPENPYNKTRPATAPPDTTWSAWREETSPPPSGPLPATANSARQSSVWPDSPAFDSTPAAAQIEKRDHFDVADAAAATSGAGEFIWPASPSTSRPSEPEDEFAPFAEFSIWNQGTQVAESTAGDRQPERLEPSAGISGGPLGSSSVETASELRDRGPYHLPLTDMEAGAGHAARASSTRSAEQTIGAVAVEPPAWQPPTPTELTAKAAPQSGSFIERYAHLFAEDDGADVPVSAPPRAQSSDEELVRKPRSMGVAASAAANAATLEPSDDEESIEQYMAKLMQRVRGEGPRVAASQAPVPSAAAPSTVHDEPPPPTVVTGQAQPLTPATSPPLPEARPEFLTSLGTVRRQPITAENSANLEALRALANETARKAISTHALQKHRRDAVTKVIVAALAGMTSIFVMLEAPGWLDLQFITACVSLLVAAYWAGQTYLTMVESFRAAAYDGPEELLENLIDPFRPPLPIDVER
jgi:hypothetical protein